MVLPNIQKCLWDHYSASALYVASEVGLFSQDLHQRAGLWVALPAG